MRSAIVCSTIGKIQSNPVADAELIDEVLYGMEVTILAEQGDYCKIRTFYNYEGFIRKDELVTDKTLVSKWQQGNLYIVKSSFGDVLDAPKYQGKCLVEIPRGGCVLNPESSEEGWKKVKLIDGSCGYIRENHLMSLPQEPISDEDTLRHNLVETARSYLGTQYRWGGKSPLGIDCSGLVSMAYMLNGVIIYRDAMLKEGFRMKEISFDDKKPGDAMYFPGHIAMYIGDDYYIHSTGRAGSDGVVINSLDPTDPLYREDLPEKLLAVGSIFAD